MSKFQLNVSADDEEVAYLQLPTHPGSSAGVVKKSVSLSDVLGPCEGPDLVLDFDADGVLIGVEVIG